MFRCQQCFLLDTTLSRVETLIESNENIPNEIRSRLLKSFTRDSNLVLEWKKHQLRSVHQEAARDHVLQQLNEKSVSNQIPFFTLSTKYVFLYSEDLLFLTILLE